jgi:sugar lactone lactonase YvrE
MRYTACLLVILALAAGGCGSKPAPASPSSGSNSSSAPPAYNFDFYFGSSSNMLGPAAAAYSGNELWVACENSSAVETFGPALVELAAFTTYDSSTYSLSDPTNLKTGPDGTLYVVDDNNDQIAVFSPTGIYEGLIPSTNFGGYAPDDVYVNSNAVYVLVHNSLVVKYAIGGAPPSRTFTHTAFSLTGASIPFGADGINADSQGNFYITSGNNARVVMEFNASGGYQQTFTAPGTGTVNLAQSVVDNQGYVYTSDAYNAVVYQFSPSGALVSQIGGGTLVTPFGLTFDSQQDLLVCDQGANRIVVFNK